jgi:hypothetical protein
MKKRKRVLRKANKKKLRLQSKNLQFKPKKKAREKVKKRKKTLNQNHLKSRPL